MAVGWFLVPYRLTAERFGPLRCRARYPAVDDYTPQIQAAGGTWAESEILGDHCLVKVRSPAAVLDQLAAVSGFRRLPKDRLDDPLADLPAAAKTALRDAVLGLGYTQQEIADHLPDPIGSYTLRQVLQFLARRRISPRYDKDTDQIVFDGPEVPCRSIAWVDAAVAE